VPSSGSIRELATAGGHRVTAALNAEWSYGWQPAAAQRLRFLIDFSYSTGLRAGEFARAMTSSPSMTPTRIAP